jgi:hypothetical protein
VNILRFLIVFFVATSSLGASPPVPEKFVGDWIPNSAKCGSALGLRVQPSELILINGSRSRVFGRLDVCHSCEGGARQTVEAIWVTPASNSGQPALTVRLYAQDKKGRLSSRSTGPT